MTARAVAFTPSSASHGRFARLSMGARVGSYHAVLAASHEHGMLERAARLTAHPAREASVPLRSEAPQRPPYVHRWEDDGGSVRDEFPTVGANRDSSPPPPL